MAAQYSCLENPMDGGVWWAAVHGITTEWVHFHFSLSCTGEGNGNPLQCSYLENLRDGRAWWAAVYGVAQSWTRLKRLRSSSSSKWYSDKESSYQCRRHRRLSSLSRSGRSPGGGNGNPPTPVFLPGKVHGQSSLAGSSSWSLKESDTAEPLIHTQEEKSCHIRKWAKDTARQFQRKRFSLLVNMTPGTHCHWKEKKYMFKH